MACLNQPDYVRYACSCGQLKGLTNIYFCRHCLKIRCSFCICHEVDSHFCANCLENMPSSEARLKKNRCSSCFDCPSCFHTLSTRATLAQPRQTHDPASGDAKVENKQPKKMYYLSCFNCRWTSRDVGIPDQPVASGGWPERPNPHATRFNQLLDYYKAIAQQEKQEKIDKKYSMRTKYTTLTDKTGVSGAMARNLAGLPPSDSAITTAIQAFTPSQASEEVAPLPDDYYTKDVNLKLITNMAQRLASPDTQPVEVSRLHFLPRGLTVKRSQRCRHCDHNLTKPEYNPGSIKFKIELLAYYHVPEIKIMSCEPLKVGAKTTLMLKLTNPTAYEMQIRLLPVRKGDGEIEEGMANLELEKDGQQHQENQQQSLPPPSLTVLPTPAPCHVVSPSCRVVSPSCRVVSPSCHVVLHSPDVTLVVAQRDDAAEYDDVTQAQPQMHEMVVWRKSNKIVVKIAAELLEETPALSQIAKLCVEYTYRNTVPAAGTSRPTTDHVLKTNIFIDLGAVKLE